MIKNDVTEENQRREELGQGMQRDLGLQLTRISTMTMILTWHCRVVTSNEMSVALQWSQDFGAPTNAVIFEILSIAEVLRQRKPVLYLLFIDILFYSKKNRRWLSLHVIKVHIFTINFLLCNLFIT